MKSFFIGNKEIKLPLIQGGMGVGVSMSRLASAVANEGGIGVISCAGIGLLYEGRALEKKNYLKDSIYGLEKEIELTRTKTAGIVGVNIMVALTNYADMVRTAISKKIDIIFSGAGLPLELPSYLEEDSTSLLVPIVSSARAAHIICEKWHSKYQYLPDAIVLEGPKAGGHLGYKKENLSNSDYSLEELIPEILEVIEGYSSIKKIPLIVAGGISNGDDIYKFLHLGASAVQMGSIFVPTHECDASEAFKQAYIDCKEKDLIIIDSPVGMPGRAINGQFINLIQEGKTKPENCPYHCIKTCDYKKSPYCIIKALYNAGKGDLNKGYAFAGENAYLSKKISSVKEVISNLKAEYLSAKQRASL